MKIIFIVAAFSLFRVSDVLACSREEIIVLDKQITDNQKAHEEEKLAQFESYMQQIKTKRKFSDKDLFVYRTKVLNAPEVKKFDAKERATTHYDYMRITQENDCKKLKKWTDESMASANKQWDIVFEVLEKELNN